MRLMLYTLNMWKLVDIADDDWIKSSEKRSLSYRRVSKNSLIYITYNIHLIYFHKITIS